MTSRLPRAALALACVAPLLGGCFISNPNTQAAISAILANPANTSAGQIYAAVATLDPEFAARVESVAAQAQVGAQIACGVLPAVSSLGAIAAAAYGAEGIYLTAAQLAGAFCTPYMQSAVKVSMARRLVRAPAPAVLDAHVSRPVEVNGIIVPAEGIVKNPALIR